MAQATAEFMPISHLLAIAPLPQNVTTDASKANALDATSIKTAVSTKKAQATKATKRAAKEEADMTKSLAFATKQRERSTKEQEFVTPLRKPAVDDPKTTPAVKVGQYVQVEANLGRIGPARHGGKGQVIAVSGVGGKTVVSVRYPIGGHTEHDIPMEDYTQIVDPRLARLDERAAKGRHPPPSQQQLAVEEEHPLLCLSFEASLKQAARTGRKEGWRRKMMFGTAAPTRFSKAERAQAILEYKEVLAHKGGTKHAMRNSKSGGRFVARTTIHAAYVKREGVCGCESHGHLSLQGGLGPMMKVWCVYCFGFNLIVHCVCSVVRLMVGAGGCWCWCGWVDKIAGAALTARNP